MVCSWFSYPGKPNIMEFTFILIDRPYKWNRDRLEALMKHFLGIRFQKLHLFHNHLVNMNIKNSTNNQIKCLALYREFIELMKKRQRWQKSKIEDF